MSSNGRDERGWFTKNNKIGNKGRPPRNYSIAHAMSIVAESPESVDNDGNPLTKAQAAAIWLWDRVFDAKLAFRDRLDALKTILSRIEPEFKLTEKQMAEVTDEGARLEIEKLSKLSPEELSVLEKIATR